MTKAVQALEKEWRKARFRGVKRTYSAEEVVKLRGSVEIEYTLAKRGAERLWEAINKGPYVNALGALTGNQALQMAKAGLQAIYLSGWQVAADANLAGEMYPDQSLYPADSVPAVVKRINNTFKRADEIDSTEGAKKPIDWFLPIVADAEAGFGGVLNVFELTKDLIEAGAAALHLEDQLSSAKKCGHMGGKVLVPVQEHINKLTAARLAADTCGVPMIVIARTDANGAFLLTSDHDERDHPFIEHGERTAEGFYNYKGGIEAAIMRGLAYAPYCDLIWCETSKPDLEEAKQFAKAIKKHYPNKMLSYNCSPSFNWKKYLKDKEIAKFQKELGKMGYSFQFITLAGFHALNYSMFDLAHGYARNGMTSYVKLQQEEFNSEKRGYTATAHQREVGTGYFDAVNQAIMGEQSSTVALKGSTEEEQF